MQTSEWIEVANVNGTSPGKLKYTEVNGKEILIVNVDGKFYAISDRYGHMKGRLSGGGRKGNIVTCRQHGASFDVTTGKKRSEPRLGGNIPDMDRLPKSCLRMIEHSAKMEWGR
jgi:nitrite reductase/ring-hydroxylating ferredoxin subunit